VQPGHANVQQNRVSNLRLAASAPARTLVMLIYTALDNIANIDQDESFLAWKSEFVQIHGELERKRGVDRDKISHPFNLPHQFDLTRFVLAVEVSLAIRMRILTALALKKVNHERWADDELPQIAIGDPTSHPANIHGFQAYEWPTLFMGVAKESLAKDIEPFLVVASEINENLDLSSSNCIDWFQDYYAALLPKEIRHALGSYYTPEWLVTHVISAALSYTKAANIPQQLRIIDPTVGSGVFLVGWLRHLIITVDAGQCSADDAMQALFGKIVGIDISHLAITAAQSNLIVAACILQSKGATPPEGPIRLPIIHGDALDLGIGESPAAEGALFTISPRKRDVTLVPEVLREPFDLVIGNPPWVNWEYMPPTFRSKHEGLWPSLGLFSSKGRDKSFSKEDVSALFFHYSIASFLGNDGVCAMVLPQSLLKSSLNGRGFRKLWLAERGADICILHVDDMTDIRPFEGVANRTAVIYASIGLKTKFPVPYDLWSPKVARRAGSQTDKNGRSKVRRLAAPACSSEPGGPWVSGSEEILAINKSLEGKSAYRARTGLFTGGANAVYHVDVIKRDTDGTAHIRNIVERAKRAAPEVETTVEPTFLYPFLRGREVGEWCAKTSVYVLLPHTLQTRMAPVSPDEMRAVAPRTLEYFERFRDVLLERKGFTAWERQYLNEGFYAVQRVGDYTFAKHKVVWRYIAASFTCAVVEGTEKPIVPNEKLMLISCDEQAEAYFVCGVLSSSVVRASIEARMVSTQIAPYLIEGVRLPKWDSSNETHQALSAACQLGHEDVRSRSDSLAVVDGLATELFGLAEKYGVVARKYISLDTDD
jgi:N-6 DNA Methylase